MPRGRKKKNPVEAGSTAVAVDLGTSTTYVCVPFEDGHYECMQDADGNCPTPTAIAFENGDATKPLYGRAALNYQKVHPEWVSVLNKRLRGAGEIVVLVTNDGQQWSAEDLEAKFLQWLLGHVEVRLGKKIEGVVITVPACFDDAARRASMAIVERAGYPCCLGVVNEPTGAVVCGIEDRRDCVVLVNDIGGGTSDVSIARLSGGEITILATCGKPDLGGKEVTMCLVGLCQRYAKAKGREIDPERNFREYIALENECETAKISLSSQETAIIAWHANGQFLELEVTRAQFDAEIAGLREANLALVKEAMASAHLTPTDIDGVLMVGDGSRVPSIRNAVIELFGEAKAIQDCDPGKAVATGAAKTIANKVVERIASGDIELVDQLPEYLLDPEVTVRDILGQTLGVKARNSRTNEIVLAPIVEKNAPIPITQTRKFGLLGDRNASDISPIIVVLEGTAGAPAEQARVLAEFPLKGLPFGPLNDRVAVTFSIDANGVATVTAVDTFSGKEIKGTVDVSHQIRGGATAL